MPFIPSHCPGHIVSDICVFRYYAAVEAKKERSSKHAQSFGTKKVSQSTTPNQVCALILNNNNNDSNNINDKLLEYTFKYMFTFGIKESL